MMKPIFVPYVNPNSNRDSFPSDEILNKIRSKAAPSGFEPIPDHEAVIGHALQANHVICAKTKDGEECIATIYSNLVVMPSQVIGRDEFLIGCFLKTKEMIQSLLNNIPGFRVKIVAMLKEDIASWLQNLTKATLEHQNNSNAYSEMPSGVWYIQYTWANPFKVRTDLYPADIAMNYMADSMKNQLYREGYTGVEGILRMLDEDLIHIEAHPYLKGSFKVLINKQMQDTFFAPALASFTGNPEVYECGKNDLCCVELFRTSNEQFIGSWYAIKEDMNSVYSRLKT